jgi:hypothetical protein
MVDSRDKGSRAEIVVRDILREHTKLKWERVPGSGALNEKHGLKGDLYIPGEKNLFAVEVKHYAEDHFNSSLFTGKSPQLLEWWEQAVRQGKQIDKKPLLLFKHDRSKIFAAYEDMPNNTYRIVYVDILGYTFYVSTLTDWLINEKPKFIL